MFKYPLDLQTMNEFFAHLLNHDKYHRENTKKMASILAQALYETDDEDTEWQKEAKRMLRELKALDIDHDNRRFNEANVLRARGVKNTKIPEINLPVFKDGELTGPKTEGVSTDGSITTGNKTMSPLPEDWNEDDLARHFGEKKPKKSSEPNFKQMTLDEIETWEKQQDNSNDIYKIKARVMNLARSGGLSITPVGEMLANTFVHVVKDLYDFAETIPDKNLRIQLIERVRKHEGMPGNLIAATKAGVKK